MEHNEPFFLLFYQNLGSLIYIMDFLSSCFINFPLFTNSCHLNSELEVQNAKIVTWYSTIFEIIVSKKPI